MPRESLDLDKHSHQLRSSWSKKSHHLAKKHRLLEEETLVKNSLWLARVFLLCVTIATRCQCNSIVSGQSEFANNKPRFEAAADEPFTTSISSRYRLRFVRNKDLSRITRRSCATTQKRSFRIRTMGRGSIYIID